MNNLMFLEDTTTADVGYGFGTVLFYVLVGLAIVALAVGCFINARAIIKKLKDKKKKDKDKNGSIEENSVPSDSVSVDSGSCDVCEKVDENNESER